MTTQPLSGFNVAIATQKWTESEHFLGWTRIRNRSILMTVEKSTANDHE